MLELRQLKGVAATDELLIVTLTPLGLLEARRDSRNTRARTNGVFKLCVYADCTDWAMELLLIRIDHLHDRKQYVSILREWLKQIGIDNGRLITVGDLHLLFIAADAAAHNDKLLEFYRSKSIDTNSRDELCIDRFIDVLGRKKVDKCACKSFLEMNILNESMLRKLLVQDWQAEEAWIDTALATPRSKAFLEWRDAAKAARRDRRKRSAQERIEQREAKKTRQEQEAADATETGAGKPVSDVQPTKDDAIDIKKEPSDPEKPPATAQPPVKHNDQDNADTETKKKKKKRKSSNKHKKNQAAQS